MACQATSKRRPRIGPFGNGVGPVSILAMYSSTRVLHILGPTAAAQQNMQSITHALLSSQVVELNRDQAQAGTIVISGCGFQGRMNMRKAYGIGLVT
jgi:hypothetical protein